MEDGAQAVALVNDFGSWAMFSLRHLGFFTDDYVLQYSLDYVKYAPPVIASLVLFFTFVGKYVFKIDYGNISKAQWQREVRLTVEALLTYQVLIFLAINWNFFKWHKQFSWRTPLEFFGSLVLFNQWFYWNHRLWHRFDFVFKRVHEHHHLSVIVWPLTTLSNNWAESLLTTPGLFLGPASGFLNIYAFYATLAWIVFFAVMGHSRIPVTLTHATHHTTGRNLSFVSITFGPPLDKMFGTHMSPEEPPIMRHLYANQLDSEVRKSFWGRVWLLLTCSACVFFQLVIPQEDDDHDEVATMPDGKCGQSSQRPLFARALSMPALSAGRRRRLEHSRLPLCEEDAHEQGQHPDMLESLPALDFVEAVKSMPDRLYDPGDLDAELRSRPIWEKRASQKQSSLPVYTMDEVSKHTDPSDMWIAINGRVIDVTEWQKYHPGGPLAIQRHAGKDATQFFLARHPEEYVDKFIPLSVVGLLMSSS